jgi:hypothetical protein
VSLYPPDPEIGEIFNNRQWNGTAWVALNNPLSVEYTTGVEFTVHTSASANVHGIINSASVVYADDAKLFDARTPTAHAATHGAAGADAITVAQSQVTDLTTDLAAKIPSSLVDAAGDLIVGSADNTVGRLGLGSNGQVLTVDTAGTGVAKVKWATPGDKGDQGDPGVVTATSPATYDAPTQTVGVDQTAISIGVEQVTGAAPQTCLYLPGASPNSVSCPNASPLQITGDLDLRILVDLDSYTPTVANNLIGKVTTLGNQRSFIFTLQPSGVLRFTRSVDGVTALNTDSTAAVSSTAGKVWLRVTLDVDNGASGFDVEFFTSVDGVTWTQLGSTVTTAGTISIFASTSPVQIGNRGDSGGGWLAGKVFRAIIKDGIGGTTVADWQGLVPALRYRDEYSNVWTVNGTANGWMIA